MNGLRVFFLTALVFFQPMMAAAPCYLDVESNQLWLRHTEPNGIGFRHGYTTLQGFFVSAEPMFHFFPYADARWHIFNDGNYGLNVGVGGRTRLANRFYGGNAYYDYRGASMQPFNQLSFGFETVGKRWDAFVNGYIVIGRKNSPSSHVQFDHFADHFLYLKRKKQSAFSGVDGTFRFHFIENSQWDCFGDLGAYYYHGSFGQSLLGGRSRLGAILANCFFLEGTSSYDHIFKWIGQATVGFRISFGQKIKFKDSCTRCCEQSVLAARLMQMPNHNEIIVVHSQHLKSKAIDPATSKPYLFWFVNNTSSSNGTFESPYSNLLQAENSSSSHDVIYVFPGNGTTQGMDTGITLKEDQRFWGAGISHNLPTTRGLVSIPSLARTFPQVKAPAHQNVVQIANRNRISGFYITSDAGGTALDGFGIGSLNPVEQLEVSQNTLIANNGSSCIFLDSASGNMTITQNTFASSDQNGVYGIYLHQQEGIGSYTLQNNVISNLKNASIPFPQVPSGTAIAIQAQNQAQTSAFIRDNVASDCEGTGIDVRVSDTAVLRATIGSNQLETTIGEYGIYLETKESSLAQIDFLNNQIKGYPFGVEARLDDFSRVSGSIHNNTLSAGQASGIVLEMNRLSLSGAVLGEFRIFENDISLYPDAQGIGIATYGGADLSAFIENNEINHIGKAGLFVAGDNTSENYLFIRGNYIDSNNGGIEITSQDHSTFTVILTENVITNNNGAALFAPSFQQGSIRYEILSNQFSNNNIQSLNTGSAITMLAHDSSSVCLRLENNQSSGEAPPDYDLENQGTGQFFVEPPIGNTGSFQTSGLIPVPPGTCGN